jgi:lysophospholipase L1-like esterase
MKKLILMAVVLLMTVGAAAQERYQKVIPPRRYEEANKEVKVRPLAVLFGDSITDAWPIMSPEFFTLNNLIGRGISGETTGDMLIRFQKDVVSLRPKYVVILAGTNDIAMNDGPISLEHILDNIISMCQIAKANRIQPILCSVLPAYLYSWRHELTPAEEIVELNEMIRAYAESADIPYVDYHSQMKDERNGLQENLAPDGVHPNLEGYRIMETILIDYLK